MKQSGFDFENITVEKAPAKKPVKKTVPQKSVKIESQSANPVQQAEPTESVKSPPVLTVTELTSILKESLETQFIDLWLSGEVSGFRNSNGRHYYFDIKDASSKIRAIIFGAGNRKFPFELKDGLEVICHGKISLYAPAGQYSFVIDSIEPKGVGALQLAFEQMKERLQKEGLFDAKHKKPIPFMPNKIGVVTSPTGAAIKDIINVLTRRFPNIEILLAPAKVQGEGSAEEVARCIEILNRFDDIDVLIVGRGGGSLEDLWAFNEEVVARAIFNSRIPVISAVGHEIDFTIADFVADKRAPTPSAAAEIAVPVKADLKTFIEQLQKRLSSGLYLQYKRGSERVNSFKERLKSPERRLSDLILRVDEFLQRLTRSTQVYTDKRSSELLKLVSELKHLSPLNVLAKGYSVVQKGDGTTVKRSADVNVGEELKVRLHEGELGVKVVSKI
ncbi:MAG: exodeoxyribonuclease VII large subunit [Pseudomonadota bacterium]